LKLSEELLVLKLPITDVESLTDEPDELNSTVSTFEPFKYVVNVLPVGL